jgi:hypothetical protein
MFHTRVILIVVALLCPAIFTYASEVSFRLGENFLVPVIKGWKLSATDNQNNVITSEFVPSGEITPGWSELMTLQIFIAKRDLAPKDFALRIIAAFGKRCEFYDGGKPFLKRINGYLSAQVVLSCGRNIISGKGTLTLIRAIAGRENLYVVQREAHGDPFKDGRTPIPISKLKDWERFLNAVLVCDTRYANHLCDTNNYMPFWPPEKKKSG